MATRSAIAPKNVTPGAAFTGFLFLILLALLASATTRAEPYGFSFSFSPDSTRVVTFDTNSFLDTQTKPTANFDDTAGLWDARTGKRLATMKGHSGALTSAMFSSDGTRLVTASQDTTARLWDGHTGALIATLRGHAYGLGGASFSPDGARIVTVSPENAARVWDGHSGRLIAALSGKLGTASLATFSPDSSRLLVASRDTLSLWDGQTGALISKLQGDVSEASDVLFSHDGNRIAVVTHGFAPAVLWDGHTGKIAVKLGGSAGSGANHAENLFDISSVAFSPDSTRVAVATMEGTFLWDTQMGTRMAAIQNKIALGGYPNEAVLFSADSARLITYNIDRSVALWDGHTGKYLATLQGAASKAQEGSMDGELCIALSPDSTRLVTVDTTAACLRDGQTGKLIGQLAVPSNSDARTNAHPAVSFSPDGARFIVCNDDSNRANLWDARTGRIIATLVGDRQARVLQVR